MLLCVEIDNSRISFGLFEIDGAVRLLKDFKIATDAQKTSDEYTISINSILSYHGIDCVDINAVAVASVVPALTDTLVNAIKQLANVSVTVVGKGTKTGFPIKIDTPADLGADLVANAAAVIDIKKRENTERKPCVIVDFGTATTAFAINNRGEYIGGSIMPGIGISFDALRGKTAQLPKVTPDIPLRAIGKNSHESLRSGVMLGNAFMIDGFIDRFAEEMNVEGDVEVFVTGEYALMIMPCCRHKMRYFSNLTLEGICRIYKNNFKDQ
jgi:type III pantothenate kinase